MTAAFATPPPPDAAPGRTRSAPLPSIQVLRAVAALAVLAAHVDLDFKTRLGLPDALPDLAAGTAGVDLFFVISGFIMVHASGALFGREGASLVFLGRRLARVVPLYWIVTTLYIVLSLTVPDARTQYERDLIAASYLFWPHPNFFPVVGLGWTLNYEMAFYLVFGLALVLPRRSALALVCATLLALVLAGALRPLPGAFGFWSSSIVLEFVFGILIATMFGRGWRLPAWIALALLGAGSAALIGLAPAWPGLPRGLVNGVPAAAIVCGAVLGPWRDTGRSVVLPILVLLGDASYALYLTHAFVIRFVRVLAQRGVLDPAAHPYLYAALLPALACGAAVLVHVAVERPLTRLLQRAGRGARSGPIDLRRNEAGRAGPG